MMKEIISYDIERLILQNISRENSNLEININTYLSDNFQGDNKYEILGIFTTFNWMLSTEGYEFWRNTFVECFFKIHYYKQYKKQLIIKDDK